MNDVLTERTLAAATQESRTARRVAAVVLFAVLTAVGGAIAVPLPGTPVPFTLQTMVVVLSGVLLGPALGASSQALYLGVGALGAPVFAAGGAGVAHLLGPTGGYLVSFPFAAVVAGLLAGRARARWTLWAGARVWLALLLGVAVVYAGGMAQLGLLTGDAGRALALGVLPFVVADVLKVSLALVIAVRYRTRTLGWL